MLILNDFVSLCDTETKQHQTLLLSRVCFCVILKAADQKSIKVNYRKTTKQLIRGLCNQNKTFSVGIIVYCRGNGEMTSSNL